MSKSTHSHGSQPAQSAYAYPLLIKQLLHTPLAVAPEQEIVYRDLKRYDYWTLRHRIGQLASVLGAIGVTQGDTVAIMDWDSNRYLESYFAIPMMGAVLMTVNVRLSPGQIAYTINHSGASVLLVNDEFLSILEEVRGKLETVTHCILLTDALEPTLPARFVGEYEQMLSAGSPEFVFEDFDEHTRATTFYTTGTTGLPKGVFFTHRQLVLHTLSLMGALCSAAENGRLHRDDVYMPLTPLFHVHAWGIPYVATLMGLKQVYPGRYAPDVLLGLIKRERVTFSHCVPTIMHMLLTHPRSSEVDLSGMTILSGGAALSPGLARAALERGIDIFSGYGMSETCPVLSLSQGKGPSEGTEPSEIAWRTKAGRPVALVDLRIVDENMRDLPHDGKNAGEIVARAPWLTQGYFKNAEASELLWQGGYLHTNDVGVIDNEGYLQITDRIKDVIKTGGEWISSLELEGILSRHDAVSEVAVIGVRDKKWGERPLAIVVLKANYRDKVGTGDLQEHVKQVADEGSVSKFAVPGRVIFVDAIEKTSVGKINKKFLREKYQHTE
jgi:fatty-acyl-CoA synthase